ncbi:uncharacterized protein [Littorina saxatilis]|uniref:uncharacterized protein n=1 Tax=Littorina saxatilis TaxID=31220 RepID=UPI0038B50B31
MVLNREVRISTADKGGAVVVQDTDNYIKEAERQLNNSLHYSKADNDHTVAIAKASNKIVEDIHDRGFIDDVTYRWAKTELNTVRTHCFYHLPKIHKTLENPPGQPIVSGVKGPTVKLSKLVDSWLQDLVVQLPSHVKDTTHMLQTVQDLNTTEGPFNPGTLLVTIDVVGLYTNTPHDDMETALRHFLTLKPLPNTPPAATIVQVVRHILSNNVFTFEEQLYKQEHGTAMGTPMTPTIANLFMGWLEERMLETSPVPLHTSSWKRFIDDIFLLWTGTPEELKIFQKHINTFHPTIKFTMASSPVEMPFLDMTLNMQEGYIETDLHTKATDITLKMQEGYIETDLHTKPTDMTLKMQEGYIETDLHTKPTDITLKMQEGYIETDLHTKPTDITLKMQEGYIETDLHTKPTDITLKMQEGFIETDLHTKATDKRNYLHYTSCHPRHCKENIPYSQMLRARRICSKKKDFEQQCHQL